MKASYNICIYYYYKILFLQIFEIYPSTKNIITFFKHYPNLTSLNKKYILLKKI